MECECCKRTFLELQRDTLTRDYRWWDGGILQKFIVCNSCQMLDDETFKRLYEKDKHEYPFAKWLADVKMQGIKPEDIKVEWYIEDLTMEEIQERI